MTTVLLDAARRESAGMLETVIVAIQGAFFALFPAIFVWYGPLENPLMWAIVIPCGLVTCLATAIVAWRLFGREVVHVDDDVLWVERKLALFDHRRSLALWNVRDARPVPCGRAELPNNTFGVGHAAVVVQGDQRELRCGMALGEPQAAELAGLIRTASLEARRRRTRRCS